VAFVVSGTADPGKPDVIWAKLLELCQANLADFKVPHDIHFVDDFPRATLDKVAKNKLREIADAMVGTR